MNKQVIAFSFVLASLTATAQPLRSLVAPTPQPAATQQPVNVAPVQNTQPVIEFEKLKHDFGTIREEGGPQKYRFVFTNKGKSPLNIKNVQASCGCTTPDWTKTPVAPGKKGFVEAAYDPNHRPGNFDKQLTVTSDATAPVIVLGIKGTVTPRVKTPADLYPDSLGLTKKLRMVSRYMNMGRVSPSKPSTEKFVVYNASDSAISLGTIANLPKHLTAKVEPAVVLPKATSEIIITYDAKVRGDWGYTNDGLQLSYATVPTKAKKAAKSGKTSYSYDLAKANAPKNLPLSVVATIEEEPRKLSEDEAAKSPKMIFNKKEHNFGDIKLGETVNTEFVFTNKGGAPLQIFKTKASCGCTASSPEKTTLAPGESSNIKVSFNTVGKHEGDQQQSVTIYTNDPSEPTQMITIKGKVVKAEAIKLEK
ncbi:protein of unknown function [Flexibacter flexilis DSM 6793]|uniref:DUF1573 domain-containing protein n=1 Tax=Flexibacter flexilis DSM 6793 TaxID=927664 RepID=A0A1I1LVJ4_9BACT|nr:DUF1573 domain-containing protein [Flexibacter flexilis]SFC77247.1 protein of unknown function [Flexibacter flexilis DSM 6793]